MIKRRLKIQYALAFSVVLSISWLAVPGAAKADTGLVAAYSFDEGSGLIAHDSAGNHDGTLKNGAEWTSAGKYGGAIRFDGVNDLVTIPTSSDLNLSKNFTIEAWVRPEEANEWSAVLTKEISSGLSYQLHAEGEHKAPAAYVAKDAEGHNYAINGTSQLPLNTWSHLALTSDGEHLRLYVNGTQVASVPSGSVVGGEGALQIGDDLPWLSEDGFKGLIDEVRIYNRTLSGSEITQDKESAVADSESPSLSFESSYTQSGSGSEYDLTVTAVDAGSTISGVQRFYFILNGETSAPVEVSCLSGQCPKEAKASWSHTFSHALNGNDRLTVIGVDAAGNTTSSSFDLPSEVVDATLYTGNPAEGGSKIATEWAQLHTHNARREDSTATQTRGSADCPEDPKVRCSFLRVLRAEGEGNPRNRYSEALTPLSEPQALSEAGTLLLPGQEDFGAVTGSGSLGEILQPWQVPPPGSGNSYELVVSSNEATEESKAGLWKFWIDTKTKLPVKAQLQDNSGSLHTTYYSYGARTEAGGLPADFFLQKSPSAATNEGCVPEGRLGGWEYSPNGFVNPNPTFGAAVKGSDGLVTLKPVGPAADGYEPRVELTNGGIELTTEPGDEEQLEWEVNEAPDQILETSGGAVILESPAGSPSAIISSSSPEALTGVNGESEPAAERSGDMLLLEPPTSGASKIDIETIAQPGISTMPCITKSDEEAAAVVHKEAMEERELLFGPKPSGTASTAPVVVWINPHPALQGVSVTDKYEVCNGPHTKVFGSDGRVEFGGCPVGKSVTLTVPREVKVGSTTYLVQDPSRTFNPPSGGWTVSFNYTAQTPPTEGEGGEGWFELKTPEVVGIEAGEGEAEASSAGEVPPPSKGHSCAGYTTNPYRTATPLVDTYAAEANVKVRCRADADVDLWWVNLSLERWNKSDGKWMTRQKKQPSGPGPAVTEQGPYYVSDICRGNGISLEDPKGKHWRTKGEIWVITEQDGTPVPGHATNYYGKVIPCG